jgi:CxxC-x17-CxxC domain-containing protein
MRDFNNGNKFGGSRGGNHFGGRDGGNRRFGSRDSGNRGVMHEAVCAECGNSCKVPFEPTTGKPVYCSDCFEKRGNGEDRSGGKSRGSNFDRPRFDKPRFSEKRSFSGGDSRNQGNDNEKLDMINEKLDKVLKALSMLSPKENKSKENSKPKAVAEVMAAIEEVIVDATPVKPSTKVKEKKPKAKKVVEVTDTAIEE